MEFLRFGSSIPGSYWGCCAADIIQNFKVDPDAKASIQLVEGDGGSPILKGTERAFVGMTYKEIFLQRLRFGTFETRDMPNHAFFAILSHNQLNDAVGKKWLAILKAEGFEFIRKVNNSVWNVDNYIFALVRNVGPYAVNDQFTPPPQWTDLPAVVPEPWQSITDPVAYTAEIAKVQKPLYDKLPALTKYSESEIEAAGVPVIYAGKRVEWAKQQPKQVRAAAEAAEAKKHATAAAVVSASASAAAPVPASDVFPV